MKICRTATVTIIERLKKWKAAIASGLTAGPSDFNERWRKGDVEVCFTGSACLFNRELRLPSLNRGLLLHCKGVMHTLSDCVAGTVLHLTPRPVWPPVWWRPAFWSTCIRLIIRWARWRAERSKDANLAPSQKYNFSSSVENRRLLGFHQHEQHRTTILLQWQRSSRASWG